MASRRKTRGKASPSPPKNSVAKTAAGDNKDYAGCDYRLHHLTVFVVGASGDLAKKKTYPSLFSLYRTGFLPKDTIICGYARSQKTDAEFRDSLRGNLANSTKDTGALDAFLQQCIYRAGQYADEARIAEVFTEISGNEKGEVANRLFYFAIPPSLFVGVGKALNNSARTTTGWNRFIIEKPFGRDSASFEVMHREISGILREDEIYRIDHYIGKEMVANLACLRFANATMEPLWNRNHIASVTVTFKENFGTQGRGGYFDTNGIIRDVMQNHLAQILTLVAMEPPVKLTGDFIRDEKVKVLRCIPEIKVSDCITGQYTAYGKEPGYTDDEGVPDDSTTPTYAVLVLYINNARWEGVPFIMRAGKALNERKSEVRIQYKSVPGSHLLYPGMNLPRNELVMRVQPDEALYLKTLVKKPGLAGDPVVSELDLSYKSRFADKFSELPDAYTRLILQTLIGDSSSFVRDDELREAWRIFTPLLHAVDHGEIEPILYKFGTRGPKEGDTFTKDLGYEYSGKEYEWSEKDGKAKM